MASRSALKKLCFLSATPTGPHPCLARPLHAARQTATHVVQAPGLSSPSFCAKRSAVAESPFSLPTIDQAWESPTESATPIRLPLRGSIQRPHGTDTPPWGSQNRAAVLVGDNLRPLQTKPAITGSVRFSHGFRTCKRMSPIRRLLNSGGTTSISSSARDGPDSAKFRGCIASIPNSRQTSSSRRKPVAISSF